MKIIISERQSRLLNEQEKKPIKISKFDSKKNDVLKKYCSKEIIIPKEVVGRYTPLFLSEFTKSFNYELEKSKSKMGSDPKIDKMINNALLKVLPDLQNIAKNTFYARSMVLPSYDQTKPMVEFSNKLFDVLNSQFSGWMKVAANQFVTKKNVDLIKKNIQNELEKRIYTLKGIFQYELLFGFNRMLSDFGKQTPKCTDVVIFNPYGTEPPYNPSFDVKEGNYTFFDEELILNNLMNRISRLVDSFV